MSPYDHSDQHEPAVRSNFLASRAGLVLLGFVLIAGALLFTEHRAHVLGCPRLAAPLSLPAAASHLHQLVDDFVGGAIELF